MKIYSIESGNSPVAGSLGSKSGGGCGRSSIGGKMSNGL